MGMFGTLFEKPGPAPVPPAVAFRYPEPKPCPLTYPHRMARVIPPLVTHPITIEGRTYTSKSGAAIDVPAEDARVLAANNWLVFGLSGSLETRPADPSRCEIFVETPTERVMQFDGKAWRDVRTGAVV